MSDLPIISELLKQGQEILVQIAKEPIAKKGARITSHIALPGRFLVFMPTVNHVGVSRKIWSDEERQRLSDLVCSGLQLANFWQDVAIDLEKNRIYFPRADLRKFSVTPADLERRVASPEFLALMRHEVEVARAMLRRGAELHRMVDRRLSRDLLMFAGGGLAILNAIQRVGYDVFNRRPKLNKFDYLKLGFNALTGRLPI